MVELTEYRCIHYIIFRDDRPLYSYTSRDAASKVVDELNSQESTWSYTIKPVWFIA